MLERGFFINNRYEILSRVGAGGMSDVYKAKDHKLNRNVAIKVLKNEFSKDKNFVSKFRVEAQSAASLIHPNIVNVYDVGEDAGLYYIVMELIEGITLKSYIDKKGKLSVKETISIAIQIANGIECAHNNQIVHRDIKPQNIMISREGKVKIRKNRAARGLSGFCCLSPKNRTFSVDYAGGNTLPAFGRFFPRGGRGCALLRWFLVYSCRACIYVAYIPCAIIRSGSQKVHTGFSASIALG